MPNQMADHLDHLDHIARAIERSRALLSETDEEGEPICSPLAWQRAVAFLSRYAQHVRDRFAIEIDAPEVLPGPEGSIDLHWEQPHYELLANVSANAAKPVSFYGDDREGNIVRGSVSSPENRGLLLWLATTKQQ